MICQVVVIFLASNYQFRWLWWWWWWLELKITIIIINIIVLSIFFSWFFPNDLLNDEWWWWWWSKRAGERQKENFWNFQMISNDNDNFWIIFVDFSHRWWMMSFMYIQFEYVHFFISLSLSISIVFSAYDNAHHLSAHVYYYQSFGIIRYIFVTFFF